MVIYKNRLKSDLTPEQQVLKLGLMNVRVKRHYDAIFSKYGKDKVFAVWNKIPEAQQNYIRGVVEGTLKPVPDLEDITSQILAAKDLVELQEIKAEVMADYGKPTLIKAWEGLPQKDKERITAMSQAQPVNGDSPKPQQTAAVSQAPEEQPKPEDLPNEWEPQPKQRKDRPVKPEPQEKPKPESIHDKQIKEAAMDEAAENANPSLVQIWMAFTMAESDEEVNELMGQLSGKVDAMKYVYDRLEVHKKSAEAAKKAALEETEKIYSEPIKKIEAAQRQMESYLLWQREKGNLPQDEIEGDRAIIRFRKYESIGELHCEPHELPDEYRRETFTIKPNKQAMLEAHKSGKTVEGYCEVNERTKVQFAFKSLLKRKPKPEQPKSESQPVNGDSQKEPKVKQPKQSQSSSSSQDDKPQLEQKPEKQVVTAENFKGLKKPQLIELALQCQLDFKRTDTKAVIIDKLVAHSNQ